MTGHRDVTIARPNGRHYEAGLAIRHARFSPEQSAFIRSSTTITGVRSTADERPRLAPDRSRFEHCSANPLPRRRKSGCEVARSGFQATIRMRRSKALFAAIEIAASYTTSERTRFRPAL